jgi:DNA-binding transcriptional LysR family regulator
MDRYGEMLVFIRAVEDGSFSAAGRNLSLAPSSVSKLVARIEERLGVMLFQRSRRSPVLTADGETYYAAALRAVEAMQEADRVLQLRNSLDDVLRVRSMPTFAVSQLAQHIPEFRARYPKLRLDIQLSLEHRNLLEGGIDVAIHVGSLPDSSLVAHRFTSTRWIICAAPGYLRTHGTPQTPDMLVEHACLNFAPSQTASQWFVKGPGNKPRRLKVHGDVLTNQGQMLLEIARAGGGIVRLAEFHAIDDLRAGRLVTLFPEHQALDQDPIYAVYEGRRHLSHRVRAFIAFLDETFPDHPPRWQGAPFLDGRNHETDRMENGRKT